MDYVYLYQNVYVHVGTTCVLFNDTALSGNREH